MPTLWGKDDATMGQPPGTGGSGLGGDSSIADGGKIQHLDCDAVQVYAVLRRVHGGVVTDLEGKTLAGKVHCSRHTPVTGRMIVGHPNLRLPQEKKQTNACTNSMFWAAQGLTIGFGTPNRPALCASDEVPQPEVRTDSAHLGAPDDVLTSHGCTGLSAHGLSQIGAGTLNRPALCAPDEVSPARASNRLGPHCVRQTTFDLLWVQCDILIMRESHRHRDIIMSPQWRSRAARAHEIETKSRTACAPECPVCPHPGNNLSPDWKDVKFIDANLRIQCKDV
ncbi:hypothetical protein C8R47DRAFT_1204326 [Mycena vitilis]|nr:hypothetical protein C8R47DRAFT_1204326 [Mycena vitilis]